MKKKAVVLLLVLIIITSICMGCVFIRNKEKPNNNNNNSQGEEQIANGDTSNSDDNIKDDIQNSTGNNNDDISSDNDDSKDDPSTNIKPNNTTKYYNVIYYANSGTFEDGSTLYIQSVEANSLLNATAVPRRIGYYFLGWALKSCDTNIWKLNEDRVSDAITVLYAQWSEKPHYIVTFDVNGGDEVMTSDFDVTYDESFILPKPRKAGYSFVGWYNESTQITDGEGRSLIDWNYSSDMLVTAHWQPNKYKVTIPSASGSGTAIGEGMHEYDSYVTITAIPNNSNCKFQGWFDSNGVCVTTELSYTFKMGFDVTYKMSWVKIL